MDNKGEQDQQAVELEELVKKQREAQPWFRLIVPQAGKLLVYLSQPEAAILQQFQSELIIADLNRLATGPRDKNNNDLSDLYRGRIAAFREIANMKAHLEQYMKNEKEKGA